MGLGGSPLADIMIPPEVYSMDAVDDLKNLRYFEVQELWYEEMQKDLISGRSTCTKLLKERGLGTRQAEKPLKGTSSNVLGMSMLTSSAPCPSGTQNLCPLMTLDCCRPG